MVTDARRGPAGDRKLLERSGEAVPAPLFCCGQGALTPAAGGTLDAARIERAVEALGFEVVTLERGGGRRRPLIRIRIDRPDSPSGQSTVSVDDCARVSRAIRDMLESEGEDEQDWILEVSSPGVERPLTKARDFTRFAGRRVRVRGYGPLAGRARELEGTLLGLVEGESEAIALEIDGERVEVPFESMAGARLVYSWDTGT